jgi:RimJ/RimL family protein N-acetyltransferase
MTLPHVPDALETARLTVRCPRVEDVAEIYAAVRESLDELRPWMPWATSDYSWEACEENSRGAIASFITRSDLRYHAHDRETGALLVCSGLHRIDWGVPKFEIGYWCRSSQCGKGYVTETARALTRLAFEELGAARVEIRCDDRNARSYRVAECCGFRLEGVLKNDSRAPDGSLRSTRIYALSELQELS